MRKDVGYPNNSFFYNIHFVQKFLRVSQINMSFHLMFIMQERCFKDSKNAARLTGLH